MGTNYYHRIDICEHCDRYDERHIGKSSAGWQFNFWGDDNIKSFKDWKEVLKLGGKIFDEYGTELSFKDFIYLVEFKQNQPKNHYDYCTEQGYDMRNDWKDEEGYAFTSSEFS